MKETKARTAIAAVQSEARRGGALAALDYILLFATVISAVLATHSLPAP
jgi:hypothetical protein